MEFKSSCCFCFEVCPLGHVQCRTMLGAMRATSQYLTMCGPAGSGLGWCMSRHVLDSFKQMLYIPSLSWSWGHQAISNKDVWQEHFLT